MKKPQSPPAMSTLPIPGPKTKRFRAFMEATKVLVAGNYLHWDEVRYRTPPSGLSMEEWWTAIKVARMSASEFMPFTTKDGIPFSLVHCVPIRLGLHKIDQKMGMYGARREPGYILGQDNGRKHILNNAIIEEAIRSSQLEGAATTRKRAKKMIRSGAMPTTHGEKMILNNYPAMQRILELKDSPLSVDIVFELHRILGEDTLDEPSKAGCFRADSDDVVVTLHGNPRGEIAHEPPPAAELPDRMDHLIAFANGERPDEWLHPVIRSTLVHFMIGYDHPFVDGNGRVARALFYWSMLHYGYTLAQYLAVSKILRKRPAKYARAYLFTETDEGDLTYFVNDHIEVINRSIDALASHVAKRRTDTAKLTEMLPKLNFRQIELLNHALRHPGFSYSIRSHSHSHAISWGTARSDLWGLAKRNLLLLTKHGRQHAFIAPPDLHERIWPPVA